jgi:hypothetical protein
LMKKNDPFIYFSTKPCNKCLDDILPMTPIAQKQETATHTDLKDSKYASLRASTPAVVISGVTPGILASVSVSLLTSALMNAGREAFGRPIESAAAATFCGSRCEIRE